MKTTDQNALIDALENQVELQLQEAVHTLQNLTSEILLKPAADGGWSIAQCLEHLNTYGDFYLPEIRKAIDQHVDLRIIPPFKSSWLGNYFTKLMEPGSGKKMKAFKGHIPIVNLNAPEVIATFIQQQETLLGYLRKARSTDLNQKLPLSLSRLIKLKLGDVFRFLIAHNERHLQQAKRHL
jgi:hypothetical protein